MAEFLNPHQQAPAPSEGFEAMGHPIPSYRRQQGYEHCKAMECSTNDAWSVVNGMAEQLERDKPYEAMATGMQYLDLTGTYRVMAVLLTADKPIVRIKARTKVG